MKDTTKYKFGSVAWQNAMIDNIEEKKSKNIPLDSFEISFAEVQTEHTISFLKSMSNQ